MVYNFSRGKNQNSVNQQDVNNCENLALMMDLELHEKNTVPNSLARSSDAKNKNNNVQKR